MRIEFKYRLDGPIIDAAADSRLQGNVNGPSLIRAPAWVDHPRGKYYLYFAHHEGTTIRLAFANDLDGEWGLYEPGALQLAGSGFATEPPRDDALSPLARDWLESGFDGRYPHIASPDVIVDHAAKSIHMYYHGRLRNGEQVTKLAVSDDGVAFEPRPTVVGPPYFRYFNWQRDAYAFAWPGVLYRSPGGWTDFEPGPRIIDDHMRHCAILVTAHQLVLLWTRVGDNPERILASEVDTRKHWREWTILGTQEVHRPTRGWEGAHTPLLPSVYGTCMTPVNQLRDPAVLEEDGQLYLLYSVAGEQGIALGDLIIR